MFAGKKAEVVAASLQPPESKKPRL